MDKLYVNPESLMVVSFALAKKIYDDGFIPTFLVGIWRGGVIPALYIHEFFSCKGINLQHLPIKASSYQDIGKRKDVSLDCMCILINKLQKKDRLLIVDDVFDEGRTLEKVLNELSDKVDEAKTAVIYYKPENNLTNIEPNFYILKTDKWVVFPHEVVGLTKEEIKEKNNLIYNLIFDNESHN